MAVRSTSLLLVLALSLDLLSPVDGCSAGRRKRESTSGDEKSVNMNDKIHDSVIHIKADGSLGQR